MTTDATTECVLAGAKPTCTLSPPPPATTRPSVTVFANANQRGLVTPPVVIGLLTAAALDPDALIKQRDTTVAGRHATCVDVQKVANSPATNFSACVTTRGRAGQLPGPARRQPDRRRDESLPRRRGQHGVRPARRGRRRRPAGRREMTRPSLPRPRFVPGATATGAAEPGDRCLVVAGRRLLVDARGDFPRVAELPAGTEWIPLGRLDDARVWAGALPAADESLGQWRAWPALAAELDEPLAALAGRALQVVTWRRTHRYCGACRAELVDVPGDTPGAARPASCTSRCSSRPPSWWRSAAGPAPAGSTSSCWSGTPPGCGTCGRWWPVSSRRASRWRRRCTARSARRSGSTSAS